jgi:hypothetical protein
MLRADIQSILLLLGLTASLAATPALSQSVSPGSSPAEEEHTQVIVTKPEAPAQKGKETKSRPKQLPEGMRDALKQHSGQTSGQALPMTKAEVWSVPKSKVETLKQLAGQHGAVVTEVGPQWHHIFRTPPADITMNEKQKAIMEQAKAAKVDHGGQIGHGAASRDA